MSENKGCGCGKKAEPAPPPAEQSQSAQGEQTAFRSGEAVESGVKKN
jgi:hypothetical protein